MRHQSSWDQPITLAVLFKVFLFVVFFPLSLFFVWPKQMMAIGGFVMAAIGIGVFLMMPWEQETVEVTRPVPAKLRDYVEPVKPRHTFVGVPGLTIDRGK